MSRKPKRPHRIGKALFGHKPEGDEGLIVDCPDCKGAGCRTCNQTGQIVQVKLAPDYSPGEDPLAGVLCRRAFLARVFGPWHGISDLSDATISALPADPEVIIQGAGLRGEEARVLRLQAQDMTRLQLATETGLSPPRLGRIIARLNQALQVYGARRLAELRAERAARAEADDLPPIVSTNPGFSDT